MTQQRKGTRTKARDLLTGAGGQAADAAGRTVDFVETTAKQAAPLAGNLLRGAADITNRGLRDLEATGKRLAASRAASPDPVERAIGGAATITATAAQVTRDVGQAAAPVVKGLTGDATSLAKKGLGKAKDLTKRRRG